MLKRLQEKLVKFKRKVISTTELEELVGRSALTYNLFAEDILKLENDGYLNMVKSTGRNNRTPSLAYRYHINKNLLNKEYHHELQQFRLKLHNGIHLDDYFNLTRSDWEKDLPYLKKIDTYIERYGFPEERVPAPERSFELVGDEKWLVESNGSEVLYRIRLWDRFCILPVSDPLMFAINPQHINKDEQLHLIVENKTTYQGLLPVIMKTKFSTLIYGSGNKISKSIENFHAQYPIKAEHTFFYFGDIDHSGITIWNSLYNRQQVIPALPFYTACLEREKAYGKTNQRRNEQALSRFLTFFEKKEQAQISELLVTGAYYPQEVLRTKELQRIWEESAWNLLI